MSIALAHFLPFVTFFLVGLVVTSVVGTAAPSSPEFAASSFDAYSPLSSSLSESLAFGSMISSSSSTCLTLI